MTLAKTLLLLAICLPFRAGAQFVPTPPPFKITGLQPQNGNITISWQGGAPTNQVQSAPSPTGPWTSVGLPTTASSLTAPMTSPMAFYRVMAITNPAPGTSSSLTANLTSPASGTILSGNLTLAATASDTGGNSSVARVEFYCDSSVLVGTATAAPYTSPCNTTMMPNGAHTLSARAYDSAGNSTNSASVGVTVNNAVTTPGGQFQWLRTALSQNGNAVVTGVAADHAGNIIAVGYFNGTVDLGLGPIATPYQSTTDAFVAKYTPQGALLWLKQLGSLGSDAAKSVAIDSQNNIIVVGNFQLTVDFGGGPLTAVSSVEMFVAKYSPSGACTWANGYPGLSSDVGNTVAVDGSDNVVVAADCGFGANFGGVLLSPAGGPADLDIAIGKLSGTTGATLWAASHGGVFWEAAKAVAVDRNGDVVVTGSVQGTSTDLGGGTLSASGSYNIILAKYSGANGSYRWGKLLGASGGNYGCGVATDPNTGNIVMTGLFNGTLDFGGGGINGGSIFVVGYDPNGTWLWNTVTGTSNDSGAAIRIDANGNLAVAGRCSSGIYFPGMSLSLFGNGQANFWMASFTLSGNSAPVCRWAKMVGQNLDGASNGNAVALGPSGQVVAGGAFMATEDFGGGPITATGAGYSSAFVVEYGN